MPGLLGIQPAEKKSITGSGGVREPPCAPAGPKPSILMPELQEKAQVVINTSNLLVSREAGLVCGPQYSA